MTVNMQCPRPLDESGRILLAHGEGARLSRRLIREIMVTEFDNEILRQLGDSALLPATDQSTAVSTDSYVVSPMFFPGGDIGSLAVHGTVNDLVVSGAVPQYLTAALIIEEGLEVDLLRRVVQSMRSAARQSGVKIVAGDTKVVPRHAADGLFITTTGIGNRRPGIDVGMHRIRPGDAIIVSGTIGDHGIAILACREQLRFEPELQSDSNSLNDLVAQLFATGIDVHFMRDPTRGGVSAVLHEITEATGLSAIVQENDIPLSPGVRGACELLGLDPLYVANEGKVLVVVAQQEIEQTLRSLTSHALGRAASVIGVISDSQPPDVLVRGPLGALRVLDEPTGAPLPRIC